MSTRFMIALLLGCGSLAWAGPDWKQALADAGLAYGGKRAYAVSVDRAWSERSRRIVGRAGTLNARVTAERAEGQKAAERKFREWKLWVYGPFQGDAAYPGMVTKKFEAPPELRPREISAKGKGRTVLIVPATDRMTFGAGADDLAPQRALVSWRYCPRQRAAVQIELFWPAREFREEAALEEDAAFVCAR